MIFCSRRVYLNVLTQLMDLQTLVNANYFIVDQIKPNNFASIIDEPHVGQDGVMTFGPSLDFTNTGEHKDEWDHPHPFFISYSLIFDMAAFCGRTASNRLNDHATPQEMLVNHLRCVETEISVYQELFQKQLNGDGLQILIMNSDIGIELGGHIICSFLSEVFGADICFLDPNYRPRTAGNLYYKGNKAYAQQHIRELRDVILKTQIQQMISLSQFGSSLNNLEAFLGDDSLTIEDMFHIHHLLFPNDQLPPGQYTIAHMKQMIIGRILDSTGKRSEQRQLEDLGFNNFFGGNISEVYDDALEEDFSNIT